MVKRQCFQLVDLPSGQNRHTTEPRGDSVTLSLCAAAQGRGKLQRFFFGRWGCETADEFDGLASPEKLINTAQLLLHQLNITMNH